MKFRNGIILLVISILVLPMLISAQSTSKAADENELLKIKTVKMDWPFNQHSGFINYAQELIFNREMGKEYMKKAKRHYLKGYAAISNYEIVPDAYDPYVRDTFRVDAASPYGQGVYKDFITAEYWFLECLKIVARNIEWDPEINKLDEFKSMLENTFKNLIYVTAYKGNHVRVLEYLNEYKNFTADEDYINEWEARAMGNILLVHKKYDWVFTGKQSYRYLLDKHREYLLKVIDRKHGQDAELKNELIERIYPEFIIKSQEKPIMDDTKKPAAKPKTK
jgi:hypothetical protein